MEIHQETRGRSREPRGDSTKTGTKRLFSNRSRVSDRESDHCADCGAEEDEQLHSGKRHRASDWPLTSASHAESPPSRAPLRNRNAPNSPSHRRPSSAQIRPSKFLEGSMNDRVSNKPPTTYIGDEESRDRFDQEEYGDTRGRKMARPKTFTHHPNTSLAGSSADRSDASRHSGIFRFGKSLAASFNPSNWKIFSKSQEEAMETAQQKILRERREKAESMYQELKKSGQFRDSTFHPSLFPQQDQKEPIPTKHDSGVEFGERRSISRMSAETPREEKRMGRVFLEPPQLPTGGESHFSQSPASTLQESTRKQKAKFHFKKPSLSNIRKSISENGSTPTSTGEHQARRVPSRKDLQKQQKLVKRVSDLEGKLEAARRQLAETLDEPVPSGPPPRIGRARFVPGAMPSLPSESLLSGYCKPEMGLSESVSGSQIGKAVTMDEPVMSGGRFDSEQPEIDEPTRRAPAPPNLDNSLPNEPDTPTHERVMQSVEVSEEESLEIEEPSLNTERPVVQSVKSRQVQVIIKANTSSNSQRSTRSSSLSDQDVESDYQVSESGKHETSPEPSELHASEPKPSKPSPNSKSKSKKRKSMADEKTYRPVPESESELSSLRPRRAPKKTASSNPPRKLQKTSAPTKVSPTHNQRNPAPRHRQLTPAKKVVMPSQTKSKIPVKGSRQSVSPPPSGPFTGLSYTKPSSQSIRNSDIDEAKMAAYSAIPSIDGEDVPPMPKMPAAVRLASGEVVSIPPQSSVFARKGSGSQVQRTGSKLTKARPSPRKGKKEDFEWPEDVF